MNFMKVKVSTYASIIHNLPYYEIHVYYRTTRNKHKFLSQKKNSDEYRLFHFFTRKMHWCKVQHVKHKKKSDKVKNKTESSGKTITLMLFTLDTSMVCSH